MKTGEAKNEYGITISTHVCDMCGDEFTVCPAVSDGEEGWENCLTPKCKSYAPERDIDVLFMSDAELANVPVVSIAMLKKRKQSVKLMDGTRTVRLKTPKP